LSATRDKKGWSAGLEQSDPVLLRKALVSDVGPLARLINGYARQGIMLPRSEFELAEGVRDFTVAVCGGQIAGCGALHFYGTTVGEVRSLAVQPSWKQQGLGRQIAQAIETEARQHGLCSLFAFTYVPGFFQKLGFHEVGRDALPSKVWKDCMGCPKFQCCDEIAVRKLLIGPHSRDGITPMGGEPGTDDSVVVPVPMVRKEAF